MPCILKICKQKQSIKEPDERTETVSWLTKLFHGINIINWYMKLYCGLKACCSEVLQAVCTCRSIITYSYAVFTNVALAHFIFSTLEIHFFYFYFFYWSIMLLGKLLWADLINSEVVRAKCMEPNFRLKVSVQISLKSVVCNFLSVGMKKWMGSGKLLRSLIQSVRPHLVAESGCVPWRITQSIKENGKHLW